MRKMIQVDKNRKIATKQAQWSDRQKYEAVALYKLIGNMEAVSRSLGIPRNTLFLWKKSDWWGQYEADLLQEKKALTSSKLRKLADIAASVAEDRLTNGEWVFVGGELRRKPVSALTANRILQDSLDRDMRLEEHYSKQEKAETDIQIGERLQMLFKEMAKFANAKDIKAVKVEENGGDPDLNVIDVATEDLDANQGEVPKGEGETRRLAQSVGGEEPGTESGVSG